MRVVNTSGKWIYRKIHGLDKWIVEHVPFRFSVPIPSKDVSGIQVVTLLVILIPLFLFAAMAWLIVALSVGTPSTLSNPENQYAIPKVVPSPTARVSVDLWKDHKWLSIKDAATLRQKANVVNLAQLENGGALYSATSTVQFDAGVWRPIDTRPFGFKSLTVTGTTVAFNFNGFDYNLNQYQPFFQAKDSTLYVIGFDRTLWMLPISEAKLIDLQKVELLNNVAANDNLTFTQKEVN